MAYDSRLPQTCAAFHPCDRRPILLKRGERGYWDVPNIDPDGYNARRMITHEEKEAMEIGSVFGFHVRGAWLPE